MSGLTLPVETSDAGATTPTTISTSGRTIVTAASISATSVREQDEIVYDPNDPNLGTNPERLYKFYFTAILSGAERIYVTFSQDGVTGWTTPVACTMGTGDRKSEDPSVVTYLSQRGEVHRSAGKLVMYVEDKETSGTSHPIYAYESTDGIAFTQVSGNPAIPISSTYADFDGALTGSPVARWDGTQYVVGYEGINGPRDKEAFGIAYGSAPTGLTKSPNNPLWHPDDEPMAGNSIVADTMFLDADESAIVLIAHDGQSGATNNALGFAPRSFRGRTTNLDPATWTASDIETVDTQNLSPPAFGTSDVTLDHSGGDLNRAVVRPTDQLSFGSYPFTGPQRTFAALKHKSAGAFATAIHRYRQGGAWLPASYSGAVLADSPWAYWQFEETSGTTANDASSGSPYDATLVNGVTTGAVGAQGGAFSYDGTDDHTTHTTLGNFGSVEMPGGFTVECFVKTTTTGQGYIFGVLNTGSTVGVSLRLNSTASGSALTNTHTVFLRNNSGGSTIASFTSTTLRDGSWHHLAVVFVPASATITVYVDGVSQSMTYSTTSTGTTFANLGFPLAFGARNERGAMAGYLNGSLDEVAIYPSALSAAQVAAHVSAA